MTNDEFRIWLSGYVALEENTAVLNAKQLWIIHNHLNLVEAVSGELDEKNRWLKARLQGLHAQITSTSMFGAFTQVTQQIKKWVTSD